MGFNSLSGIAKVIVKKSVTDLECVDDDRKEVFNKILIGKITHYTLKSSVHYDKISDQFDAFEYFTQIFKDENTTYKYAQNLRYSQIPADYLLTNDTLTSLLYVFITQRKNEEMFCCESFFPFKDFKYEFGQSKLTVLKIEEINIDTNKVNTVFLSPKYK